MGSWSPDYLHHNASHSEALRDQGKPTLNQCMLIVFSFNLAEGGWKEHQWAKRFNPQPRNISWIIMTGIPHSTIDWSYCQDFDKTNTKSNVYNIYIIISQHHNNFFSSATTSQSFNSSSLNLQCRVFWSSFLYSFVSRRIFFRQKFDIFARYFISSNLDSTIFKLQFFGRQLISKVP